MKYQDHTKANQEHLDILLQGVAVWNRWRMSAPNVRPDLRQANLHEANLFGPDVDPYLSHVDLHEATMYGADFAGHVQSVRVCNKPFRRAVIHRYR